MLFWKNYLLGSVITCHKWISMKIFKPFERDAEAIAKQIFLNEHPEQPSESQKFDFRNGSANFFYINAILAVNRFFH